MLIDNDNLPAAICRNCREHHDRHSQDDLSCPQQRQDDGSIVFSTTYRYTEAPPLPEPDLRASALIGAWDLIAAAQKLKVDRKKRVVDPLPELYWATIAEAAVLAQMATATDEPGHAAGRHVVSLERHSERNRVAFREAMRRREQNPAPTTPRRRLEMSTEKPPLTVSEHIACAKDELAVGGRPEVATAHALIAIAELMATNMTDVILDATGRGAMAMAETVGSVFSAINPGMAAAGPNVTVPCPVKSAGGRECIRNMGHNLVDHEDREGWQWSAPGEHAHPIDNPDGLCGGCGVPVDAAHKNDCPVYLARRSGRR